MADNLPSHVLVTAKAAAKEALAAAKGRLPAARNAYGPSGVVPALAWALMVPGAILGALAGIVAGGLTLAAGSLLFGVAYALFAFTISGHILWLAAVVGTFPAVVVTGLLAITAPPLAAGFSAGWVTWKAGSVGRSRGAGPAMALGTISGLGTLGVLFLAGRELALRYAAPGSPGARFFLQGMAGMSWWGWAIVAVAALTLALGAWTGVDTGFSSERHCERCDERMTRTSGSLSPTHLGEPIGPELLPVVALLRQASTHPVETSADLFRCPRCRGGFLDVHVTARYVWPDKAGKPTEKLEETWLASSQPVAREVADVLEGAIAA